jgi:peroxiredoxin Q/BCP
MSTYRDLATRFADANAQVLGVSMDSIEKQQRFAASLHLPFPLLSDHEGTVSAAYGVKRVAFATRTTFVIGPDGRIEKIFEGKEALDPEGALGACPLHQGATQGPI